MWLDGDGDLIPKPLLSVEQLRGRFKGEELTAMLLEERARDRTHEDGCSRRAPDPVSAEMCLGVGVAEVLER